MKLIKLIVLLFLFSSSFSQTLVLNEFSNGDIGSKEYFELVAVGTPCTTIDIRNWIIDDNNGDFSGGPSTGEGIAGGHIRFTNDPQWASVPVGSIILIYNSGDKNLSILLPDDETDSNGDSIYIVPSNSLLLEYCSAIPNSSNGSYSPCTYSSPASWFSVGLRNTGDAAQIRDNNGIYVHGLSYGANPMTGGPDGLKLSNTGGGSRVGYFTNLVSNDFTDVNNFTFGSVPVEETPGVPNTLNNLAWIQFLRGSCILEHPQQEFTFEEEVVKPVMINAHDILGTYYNLDYLPTNKLLIIKYDDGTIVKQIIK